MKIELYAPGVCDLSKVDEKGFLHVPDGITLKEALKIIKLPLIWKKIFPCLLNYEKVPMDTVLKEGDTISIFTPITGG
ncbi:MAG: MoaD/ThiS family protein [Oscillospiraceae bacterium]|nr:MoaD/ThiS family protein [Oscillospiraceae bacterium]